LFRHEEVDRGNGASLSSKATLPNKGLRGNDFVDVDFADRFLLAKPRHAGEPRAGIAKIVKPPTTDL
jgi:hypothetical protein